MKNKHLPFKFVFLVLVLLLSPRSFARELSGFKVSEKVLSESTSQLTLRNKLFGRLDVTKKTSAAATPNSPVLVMLTGLNTGPELVDAFQLPDGLTVLGVSYPVEKNQPLEKQFADVMLNVVQIQGLLTSFFVWLSTAPEFQGRPVHVMMVSFGTFIAPKPLYVAQTLGFVPTSTIFAYGGSGLNHFYSPFLASFPEHKVVSDIQPKVDLAIEFFDNKNDLKRLSGPFLVLQASEDEIIPFDAGQNLFTNLPEPKKHIFIEGPHVQLSRPDMVAKTMAAVQEWISTF